MLQSIKTRLEKTVRFIEEHPTATACALTAAISWKISHDITLACAIEETSDMAYQWGRENGVMKVHIDILYDFIDKKGLTDQFTEFVLPTEV